MTHTVADPPVDEADIDTVELVLSPAQLAALCRYTPFDEEDEVSQPADVAKDPVPAADARVEAATREPAEPALQPAEPIAPAVADAETAAHPRSESIPRRAPIAVALGLAGVAVFTGGAWYLATPDETPPASSAAPVTPAARVEPAVEKPILAARGRTVVAESAPSAAPYPTLARSQAHSPAVARSSRAAAPVRFANPFDRTEVFEFPAGTTRAEARAGAAAILLERARERARNL